MKPRTLWGTLGKANPSQIENISNSLVITITTSTKTWVFKASICSNPSSFPHFMATSRKDPIIIGQITKTDSRTTNVHVKIQSLLSASKSIKLNLIEPNGMLTRKKAYHYVVIPMFQPFSCTIMPKVQRTPTSISIELSTLIWVRNLKRQRVILIMCKSTLTKIT